jgi:hypothetical protein
MLFRVDTPLGIDGDMISQTGYKYSTKIMIKNNARRRRKGNRKKWNLDCTDWKNNDILENR